MTKMDQRLEPNTMSDLYGQEITEEEADIYLRSMSSRELKALTARNDDWFNIPIEGYVVNVGEENDDYNPEEDVESMLKSKRNWISGNRNRNRIIIVDFGFG